MQALQVLDALSSAFMGYGLFSATPLKILLSKPKGGFTINESASTASTTRRMFSKARGLMNALSKVTASTRRP